METELEPNKVQQQQQQQTTNSSSSPIHSTSSSPTHEFSFNISLHSSITPNTPLIKQSSPSLPFNLNKQQQQQQPLAIDLTPADEIFFHGHLLPLHFLSHLHTSSARPSTHSSDNFSLQVQDYLLERETPLNNNGIDNIYHNNPKSNSTSSITCAFEDDYCISFNKNDDNNNNNNEESTNDIIINCSSPERINNNNNNNNNNKSKQSFSLFRLSKWKKTDKNSTEENNNNNKIRKSKFELSQFLKRYIKMVKPLLQGGKRENNNYKGRRQSYSFSGTVSPRDYSESLRMRRGEYSAPASMRTSPTNSGLLMATSGVPSPVSDSTMEELQAAIQAAIAHCKNSSISNDNSNNNSGCELKSQELSSIAVN